MFFTLATTPSSVWGSTTSTSDFLLPRWTHLKKTRFLLVKCSENHPPSCCLKFDVQKCPVALETLDDFQQLGPTLGTHTCPCQWDWWKFCLKKVCRIGLCSNLVFIMYNKVLIYFFSLCPAWTIKPLSHFAFISNQLHSLVHWLAWSFIMLRYQKGKMALKPLKMLKFICLDLQCCRGYPLIWWISWFLCMCVSVYSY